MSEKVTNRRAVLQSALGLAAVVALLQKAEVAHGVLGTVVAEPVLRVRARHGEHDVLNVPTERLRAAWRSALPLATEVSS